MKTFVTTSVLLLAAVVVLVQPVQMAQVVKRVLVGMVLHLLFHHFLHTMPEVAVVDLKIQAHIP